MYKQGVGEFKYFVGISSLSQIATRDDRVCVLNILGGESSEVTPVGHAWSGSNVVFGTSPGRGGQFLETSAGNIPVYNSVREGLDAGHRFNCGVVYLPPSAARDGVAELIRVNPDLKKIFIITEKIAVHDAREIRAMAQMNSIDVFGANCLGVADSWNRVRIGGALGGDSPGDTLKPGSIAILSNSGGFTTTIAQYLRMAGWGTTTLVSSGKDVYIHYAAPEFAFALSNDARSKAAVLYCEPGGYYERDAEFNKPVIACVVGRWKAKLTRAVGHAGAMAGGEDDALAKERWFMEKFGVDAIFTPENPVFSHKGALVTNIAHIPLALTAVMRANATLPDFAAEGSTELKPWFGGDAGIKLPPSLDLNRVEALPPYNRQIALLEREVGAVFPRENLKDASAASQMTPATQVSTLHGVTVLEAARHTFEANICLALLHEIGDEHDQNLVNVAVGSALNLFGDPALAAAQAAREAGNAPNATLAAALCVMGPARTERAQAIARALIVRFAEAELKDALDNDFDCTAVAADPAFLDIATGDNADPRAEAMLRGLAERGVHSVFVRWLQTLGRHANADAVLAAITTTLGWKALRRKRVSRLSVETLPAWMRLFGTLIGASAAATEHRLESFCGVATGDILQNRSLTELAYLALLGRSPASSELFAFQTLLGILLTNGPGTISAQGAKGAVSSDGPETPERVQLNKAMLGFLSHCGYAHGGNGFEGVAFLLEQFRHSGLQDPTDPEHGIDLAALAMRHAVDYAGYKAERKASGRMEIRKIPGVNHPVFKDRPVNLDPREVFLRELMTARGEYNVFHDFYHAVVQALQTAGVSRTVYCVNIDAVIAALLLKLTWQALQQGECSEKQLESAAFTLFLYARMLGCAAEIDDHMNRGRNMDTRTTADKCRYVS